MTILLTFDVEDWFQVENLRPLFPPDCWDRQEWRVERSTRTVLDTLDAAARAIGKPIRGTFFVLGSVAERFPDLVREIRSRGHEVASHGYGHRLCLRQEPNDLAYDLRHSKALLEDILGSPVFGYRAPGFSISDRILDQIWEAGYRYDSSYNSFGLNPRYGTVSLNGNRKGIAYQLRRGLFELPVSNLRLLGRSVPWAGGGYFRLIPSALFSLGVGGILRRDGAYLFYLHPWECDPKQPRTGGLGYLSRFRHYCNLESTTVKLGRLIGGFSQCQFVSCMEYLGLRQK